MKKEVYCKYCGLELEAGKCHCEDFLRDEKERVVQKEAITCDTCGKKLDSDANFCPFCGIPLFVKSNDEHLHRELEGEFAEDCLEKNGCKPKSVKDYVNGMFTPTTKVISLVLVCVIVLLCIFKIIKTSIDNYNMKKYLESLEAMTVAETTAVIETIPETTTQPVLSLKDKWVRQDGYFYAFDKNDEPIVDDWVKVVDEDGKEKYYYFDIDGRLVVNSWIDGEYYVGPDGAMLVSTITPDGAEVDEKGLVVIKEGENAAVPVERETQVYYEAPNSSETVATNQRSSNSGVIKGVDPEKTYELYIKDIVQVRETVTKGNDKCTITYYYPVLAGGKEKEVKAANEAIVNMFTGDFKALLKTVATQRDELPKSIVINTVEQRQINPNRFMFLVYGKLTPKHGLYEYPKYRFNYDRKAKKLYILDLSESS